MNQSRKLSGDRGVTHTERTMHEHRERLVKMRERRKHGKEQGESGASAEPANLT